jgi:Protein of unknown function (DUF2778)
MTWIYKQSTGELFHDDELIGAGYSGKGDDKNNPGAQNVHNQGPIPQGLYQIYKPRDTADHGPFVLPLEPHLENTMFGRGGFLIHGDSTKDPGTASEGCVILARNFRTLISESSDNTLQVIA